MVLSDCPSDDLLTRFASGSVSEADLETLSRHLSQCTRCIDRLDRHTGTLDPLARGLRRLSASRPDADVDPALIRAVVTATQPRSSPDLGTQLDEYQLLEKLGEGGMGLVYKARHVRLGKLVALKLIRANRRASPDALTRFEREMQAVGRLDHPNIVRATDAGESNGLPYLAMEYLVGTNLSDLVKQHGPRSRDEACRLVAQAARGLAHAHRHGLVHRDVKPSNLLLTTDGTVKLLDLGLALLMGDRPDVIVPDLSTGTGESTLTLTGGMVGTQHYMAPEQSHDAHGVDARADVYGLGATLWYLLTAKPPPDRLPEAGPWPGHLPWTTWARLLARDPDHRFASAEEVAQILDPVSRPVRRRVPVLVLASLTVAAAVLLVVFALGFGPNSGPVKGTDPDPIEVAPLPRLVRPPSGRIPMNRTESTALRESVRRFLGQPADVTDDFGLTYSLIPAGELGLTGECRVRITRPYYLGIHEVTVGQFRRFVSEARYSTTAETNGLGGSVLRSTEHGHDFVADPKVNWQSPGYPIQSDDRPVTQVSWLDAVAFCDHLTKITGIRHRLPTEAEWIWATRAGTARWEGIKITPEVATKVMWYGSNCQQPQRVGTLEASPWGLHDVFGNVCEWCHDAESALPVGTFDDWQGPPADRSASHVVHGIGYVHPTPLLLYRQIHPATAVKSYLGFRVLREIP